MWYVIVGFVCLVVGFAGGFVFAKLRVVKNIENELLTAAKKKGKEVLKEAESLVDKLKL